MLEGHRLFNGLFMGFLVYLQYFTVILFHFCTDVS